MEISGEIVPGVGLAGIKIGQTLEDIAIDRRSVKSISGQKLAYVMDGSVCILFDDENKIRQLSALSGYKGKLNQKYYIDEPIAEIIDDGWIYSEELDGFIKQDQKGVIIRPDLEDASPDEIIEQ
ncbi:hypothetical protein FKG94_27415 [Exilibacterium tricleocarpae]|uniref:Uncharacterized protein n=1 Tax=Exilibacterium tricleocarpae TaxID=2591008 RepID=A0A545SMF4_9GAMM|nr:hypothetical protein [Exilibacterium tricleocarpae]TQV66155.1 hypothetical protein FKG94_27415 [Exilibacterium tricleocarpae]